LNRFTSPRLAVIALQIKPPLSQPDPAHSNYLLFTHYLYIALVFVF
jgi:hypothetical protein